MKHQTELQKQVAQNNIVAAVGDILLAVGENLNREGLKETPHRVARAFMESWCSGYSQDPKEILKSFADGGVSYRGIVLQRNIPVWSLCEHHMAPFFGKAHIGYIPNGRVVGLSKLSRLVDCFAKRLQVQERLTDQIADSLFDGLVDAAAVGVVLECRHSCMESRGIEREGTITLTSAMRGQFFNNAPARAEFFSLLQRGQ